MSGFLVRRWRRFTQMRWDDLRAGSTLEVPTAGGGASIRLAHWGANPAISEVVDASRGAA